MPWIRWDTSYSTNPKTKRLSWEAACAFHRVALWAKELNEVGEIPKEDLEPDNLVALLATKTSPPKAVCVRMLEEWLDVGYLVDGGDVWVLPMWGKFKGDPSAAERQAKLRAQKRLDEFNEAKKRHGSHSDIRDSRDVTHVTTTGRDGTGRDGTDKRSPDGDLFGSPVATTNDPDPTKAERYSDLKDDRTKLTQADTKAAAYRRLFIIWCEVWEKGPGTQLSKERIGWLRSGMQHSTEEEIAKAIRGSKLDDWADRPKHNELKYICVTRAQVDRFMGYEDNPPKPTTRSRNGFTPYREDNEEDWPE